VSCSGIQVKSFCYFPALVQVYPTDSLQSNIRQLNEFQQLKILSNMSQQSKKFRKVPLNSFKSTQNYFVEQKNILEFPSGIIIPDF